MSGDFRAGQATLELQNGDDLLLVEGYGDGGFRLMGGRRFEGGVVVLPTGVYPLDAKTHKDFGTPEMEFLTSGDLKPELCLIGTGDKMELLPSAFRHALEEVNIGYDAMDTGAAARTYNVLLMEGRRVAALLLPV